MPYTLSSLGTFFAFWRTRLKEDLCGGTFRQPELLDRPARSRTALTAQLGPAQRSLAAHANGRDREWDQLAATEFLNYD